MPDDWRDMLPGNAASTGPRSGERGDAFGDPEQGGIPMASTGPRSGERGDGPKRARTIPSHECFNGAALGRARRWLRGVGGVLRQHGGFNGAALGRARRLPCRRTRVHGHRRLQRGRARESAEIGSCRTPQLHQLRLQRGRARESAEIPSHDAGLRPLQPASTGPRSGERGDAGNQVERTGPAYASTGPRSGERGDWLGSCVAKPAMVSFNGAALGRARRSSAPLKPSTPSSALQRGRARESAEIKQSKFKDLSVARLQRGRARESAEI